MAQYIVALLGLSALLLCTAQPEASTRPLPPQLPIHESPYYLPGITDKGAAFPPSPDSAAGAFRVFGARAGGLGVGYGQAEEACRVVGRGLAAVYANRKAALDEVMLTSQSVTEPSGTLGCCPGYTWVAGFRTSLSDPLCMSSPVPRYPFFTVYANGTEATDYAGCGKDAQYDWGWAVWPEGAINRSYELWRNHASGPQEWWNQPKSTGTGDPEPTGWNGPFTIVGAGAGSYENCTAARTYLASSSDVFALAADKAWLSDFGCYADLDRFVCEMESLEQGMDAAGIAAVNDDAATVRNSPYFIPGVSDEVRTADDGSVAFRVFGIDPGRAPYLPREHISWVQAQTACTAMGGYGLAATPTTGFSTARTNLVRAVAPKLDGSLARRFWIGGATEATTAAAIRPPSAWAWYTRFVADSTSKVSTSGSQTTPMVPAHVPWATGFPSVAGIGEASEAGQPTSCMVTGYDQIALIDRWENIPCDSQDIRLFICGLPSEGFGMAAAAVAEPPAPQDSAAPGQDAKPPSSSGGVSGGAVAGIVLAGLAVAAVAAVLAVYATRRRGAARRDAADAGADAGADAAWVDVEKGSISPALPGPPGARTYGNSDSMKAAYTGADYMQHLKAGSAMGSTRTAPAFAMPGGATTVTWGTTLDLTNAGGTHQGAVWSAEGGGSTATGERAATRGSAASGASLADLVAALNEQLDAMDATPDRNLLGRYTLLGQMERRQGGQGVVQFARGVYDNVEYAIKFYIHSDVFRTEMALYMSSNLRDVLPTISDIVDNADGSVTDPYGVPLPPCIIMERGEALDEWSRRAQPDMPTAVQVLSHLAERLCKIHAAGMVHRDLKPGNVMWLPRQNKWTVIDFGCAVTANSDAAISCSLLYAAPEVIEALAAQQPSMTAAPALDAWSLGVMAFELLTQQRTFDVARDGKQAVFDQLRGTALLPWEGARLTADVKRRLGILRKPILGLLARDPAQRLTMVQFKDTCTSIFMSNTTFDVSNGSGLSSVHTDPSPL